MYLELVNSYRTTRKYGEDIKPRPPASEAQITEAEARLGTRFPKELRAMLLEMDGDLRLSALAGRDYRIQRGHVLRAVRRSEAALRRNGTALAAFTLCL